MVRTRTEINISAAFSKEGLTPMTTPKKYKLEHWVLWPTLLIMLSFCVFVKIDTAGAENLLKIFFNTITGKLGWVYQFGMLGYSVIFIWLAFGKYGSKKLGDTKPEFSTFKWLCLIFATSSSASVLVWTSLESFYYVKFPPFTLAPFSEDAYNFAQAYSLYHWGPVTLCLYSVLGVIFGYAMHVRKKDITKPSGIFGLLYGDEWANSWKGKLVDILSLFSLITGYATTLGICTPLLGKILEHLFGVTLSTTLDIIILLAVTSLITLCVYTGLYKGIALLSTVRIYVGYGLLIFLFLIGPTAFMLNNFTNSFGIMVQNIVRMTTYYSGNGPNTFPQDWTIFYFAWFTAIAVVCGTYLARISAGRTVRQVLCGSLGAYVLGNWIYFIVLQNYSISIQKMKALPFDDILATGGVAGVTVATWSLFPFATVLIYAFLLVAYINTTTFVNGAVYTCAMMTTKDLPATEQPGRFLRVAWAVFIGTLAIALLFIGGLKPVQTISIIGSFPMTLIIFGMFYAFFKVIIRDKW